MVEVMSSSLHLHAILLLSAISPIGILETLAYQIGIQTRTSNILDCLLSWFSLLLLIDHRYHGDVDMQEVTSSSLSSKLSQCLNKWSIFDVTHCSTTALNQLQRGRKKKEVRKGQDQDKLTAL